MEEQDIKNDVNKGMANLQMMEIQRGEDQMVDKGLMGFGESDEDPVAFLDKKDIRTRYAARILVRKSTRNKT